MELSDELQDRLSFPDTKEMMEEYKQKEKILFSKNTELVTAKQRNNTSEVSKLTSETYSTYTSLITILDEMEQFFESDIEKARKDIANTEANTLIVMIILTVASVVLGIIIAYVISRSIANPVKKVTAGLSEIAGGNLAVEPIRIKNKDEVGDMAKAFNTMAADLKQVVSSVRDSSMQLAANAEQLSASAEESLASSQMVAKSAEEQMATSEQQVQHMDISVELDLFVYLVELHLYLTTNIPLSS
jgi:methyl-accepting chemotaxis protein